MRMKQFDSTTGHVSASAGEDEEKFKESEKNGVEAFCMRVKMT